jgi:ABC-2 type transport system ATP-binding protein
MWQVVRELRDSGVTIILTTHYIEEAELMADRVGVINKGELVVVEKKEELMRKMGSKRLVLQLDRPLAAVPPTLASSHLSLSADGKELTYTYDTKAEKSGIGELLEALAAARIGFHDLQTSQSSLEEIFVGLVHGGGK